MDQIKNNISKKVRFDEDSELQSSSEDDNEGSYEDDGSADEGSADGGDEEGDEGSGDGGSDEGSDSQEERNDD